MSAAVVFTWELWGAHDRPSRLPFILIFIHCPKKNVVKNIISGVCAVCGVRGRSRVVLAVVCRHGSISHTSYATVCVTSMITPVCCMWQALFSRQFGEVVCATLFDKCLNPEGRPVPKYGFVTFRKVEDCLKALNSRVSPAGWSSPLPFVCL